MLFKGDKIELNKKMGMFDNIGEVCDVVNITEDGCISFRFRSGIGCMSYDEFEKYFKKVNNIRTDWTDWKLCCMDIRYEYKTNNKSVLVRLEKNHSFKGKSTCHKDDVFDLEKGIRIALFRAEKKIIDNEIEELINEE